MYKRLYIELKARKITHAEVAKALGITAQSFSYKVNGKSDFTAPEMFIIKKIIKDVPMEQLFKKEN